MLKRSLHPQWPCRPGTKLTWRMQLSSQNPYGAPPATSSVDFSFAVVADLDAPLIKLHSGIIKASQRKSSLVPQSLIHLLSGSRGPFCSLRMDSVPFDECCFWAEAWVPRSEISECAQVNSLKWIVLELTLSLSLSLSPPISWDGVLLYIPG
jgi:hypothetical protein